MAPTDGGGMLRAETKKAVWLGAAAFGFALIVLAVLIYSDDRAGLSQLGGFFGALLVVFGLIFGLHAARDARAGARIRAGADVIARWRVGPAEWERFVAFDAARGESFASAAWLPSETPADGVEIVVGAGHVLLGDALVAFEDALVKTSLLCLVELPSDPPCLELVVMTRGKSESVFFLRLPVTENARADAERAVTHLHDRAEPGGAQVACKRFDYDLGKNVPEGMTQVALAPPRPGFASRNRQQVRTWGYAAAVFVPLLGVHFGSVVGQAIGGHWGLSTMIGALVLGIAIGLGTWTATRKGKPR